MNYVLTTECYVCRFTKNMSPDKIRVSTLKGEGDLSNLELDECMIMEVLDLPTWLRLTRATCNRLAIKVRTGPHGPHEANRPPLVKGHDSMALHQWRSIGLLLWTLLCAINLLVYRMHQIRKLKFFSSCLVMQLSLPNPLKPGAKTIMM